MTWYLDHPLFSADPFRRLLDEFWGREHRLLGTTERSPAVPPLRAAVSDEDILVTLEVPGVEPSDVEVSVDGNVLKVSGERRDERTEDAGEDERFHRKERFVGRFERHLELPFRVAVEKVEARFDRGILEIRLPRTDEDRPRKIPVKA